MPPSPTPLDEDTVLSLLTDPRRRIVLHQLLENDSVPVWELSDEIASFESEKPGPMTDADARNRVLVSLVHNHLPCLEDHGIIETDQQVNEVGRGPNFEQFRTYLKMIEEDSAASQSHLFP